MTKKQVSYEEYKALIDAFDDITEALAFYASPDSYFAISVIADRPSGDAPEYVLPSHGTSQPVSIFSLGKPSLFPAAIGNLPLG